MFRQPRPLRLQRLRPQVERPEHRPADGGQISLPSCVGGRLDMGRPPYDRRALMGQRCQLVCPHERQPPVFTDDYRLLGHGPAPVGNTLPSSGR